jgi:hypothetical protein
MVKKMHKTLKQISVQFYSYNQENEIQAFLEHMDPISDLCFELFIDEIS